MIDYDRARSVRPAATFVSSMRSVRVLVCLWTESLSVDAIVHCRQLIIVISVWRTSLSVDAIAV